MMEMSGLQKVGVGTAVDAAQGEKVGRNLWGNRGEKEMGLRGSGHPGQGGNVLAWHKTGLITGKVRGSSRRFGGEREEICCEAPDVNEGTNVCRNCGAVVSGLMFEHRLDYSIDRNGRQLRHAEPVGNNIKGPRTLIAPGKKDGRGKRLSGEAESLYMRLSMRNKLYGSGPKRSYFEAELVRRRILDRLEFRDPSKISRLICWWAAKNKIAQGRTLEATTAAAVYVAAVEQGFPVTYTRMGACSHVLEDRLRRVVAMYLSKRPAGRGDFPVKLTRAKYFTPDRHIRHICTELGLAPLMISQAETCAQDLDRRHSSGHRPENKAAAAVKATCGDLVSWNDLARVTGVQLTSLKAYWNKVVPLLEALGYLGVARDLDCDARSTSEIGS